MHGHRLHLVLAGICLVEESMIQLGPEQLDHLLGLCAQGVTPWSLSYVQHFPLVKTQVKLNNQCSRMSDRVCIDRFVADS